MAKELKQQKRADRGVVVPPHKAVPYDPENIHLSKAQFIAKQKVAKEKAIKVAEFEASLDKKSEEEKIEVKEEKEKTKKRGRPLKVE
jgi:hypothetical protein